MLSGDQSNGVSELAEGYTYIRGRCKQFGNLYSPIREDTTCFAGTEYETIFGSDDYSSAVDGIQRRPEDICRRVSMSEVKNQDHDQENNKETTLTANALSNGTIDRRLSRDVGIQAFSIDIEETPSESTDHTTTIETISHDTCIPRRKSVHCDLCYSMRQLRHSACVRRNTYHFHKLISPQRDTIFAHCPSNNVPILECKDSLETLKSVDGAHYTEIPVEEFTRHKCHYLDSCHCNVDNSEQVHRYSACSLDSSTIAKCIPKNYETTHRCNRCKPGLAYFMDPCIEDSTENTAEGEYNESEQSKPLLDKAKSPNENATNSFKKKSISEAPTRRSDGLILPKVEGIELGNDAVCPFGLAKKIIVVPSRRKKSSGRPSFLKLITLVLIGSAILITSAAIKEAYY